MSGTAISTHVADGIARVVFDVPGSPVNTIGTVVKDELEATLMELRGAGSVRAIVLSSGKPDNFMAGADIEEFVRLETAEQALRLVRAGQALINKLADFGKPVVVAINGACLGGGLEASLACTYRIATTHPKTRIGLPEVQLGIIPAAGGCQRLPRLIGLRRALDIILAGKTVPAAVAHRRGIVDEVVHPAVLDEVAERAARRLADGWRPTRPTGGVMGALLDRNPIGRRIVASQAEKQIRRSTGGHYPAPLAALDAVMHGLAKGVDAGLDREAEHFAELALGEVSRHLVQIFFADRSLAKDTGVDGPAPQPRPVRNLAVVGAGFMGAAIGGTAALKASVDVRFRDAAPDRVQAGLNAARSILERRLKRKRISRHEYYRKRALLSGATDLTGFHRADLVIEAVFEDLDVKRQVFRELEAAVRDNCVLASNTSTIPISRIAEVMDRPDRVLGMHFFSPVEKMLLLEIIVTDKTSPSATVTAVAFGRAMGKKTVVVRDRPGFWVNRILSPYINESARLVEEGVKIEEIDAAMKHFGFPVGPITLLDEVGLDVAYKAGHVMHEAFGQRMQPGGAVARLLEAGRKGRKNGTGFYRYEDGKRKGVDESAYDLLKIDPQPVPGPDIQNRLIFAMLNEAALALEEEVVRSPRDGDIAAIFGIGFPPFVGGPLRYLDGYGIARSVDMLARLEHAYGERFAAAPLLRRMADGAERFYPSSP